MNNDTLQSAAAAESSAGFRFRAAYEKTAAARAAIDPVKFASLTVDVGLAVSTVIAAHPRIQALRKQIEELPLDLELIDQLDTFAHAAGHALALYKAATTPPEQINTVYEEATARRAALKSDATNLALHRLLDGEAVAALNGDIGFRNVGYELMSLVSMLRAAGSRVAGRSATLPEDLDRAEVVANELLELAALRDARRGVDPNVSENRQRAFTLMCQAYSQARRAVVFLRWDQGDAATIAPSIYSGKSNRRKESDEESDVTTDPLVGPAPAVNPLAVNPLAVNPLAVTTTNAAGGTSNAAPAAPGMMGGSPFGNE